MSHEFQKLAGAMAKADTAEEDSKNLGIDEMSDAIKALADVYVQDSALFEAGFYGVAVPAARLRRKAELDQEAEQGGGDDPAETPEG